MKKIKPLTKHWIFWRWKEEKRSVHHSYIQEIRGDLIALTDGMMTRYPSWTRISEITIFRQEARDAE